MDPSTVKDQLIPISEDDRAFLREVAEWLAGIETETTSYMCGRLEGLAGRTSIERRPIVDE